MKVICAWCYPGITEDPFTGERYSHGICGEHVAEMKEQIRVARERENSEKERRLKVFLGKQRN